MLLLEVAGCSSTYTRAENTEASKPASRRNTDTLRIDVMTIMLPLLRPGQISIFMGSLARKPWKVIFFTTYNLTKWGKGSDLGEEN